MVLDEHILRRLAYAKRLYMHGAEHLENDTQIDLALAILNFDNAIEMMLSVALEFLGSGEKDNFHDLLNTFLAEAKRKQLKVKIPKSGINNLHLARNKVQHSGIVPCAENLKIYQTLTEQLLVECMKGVFNVEIPDVSLGMLIKDEIVSELYRKGELNFLLKDFYKSLICCVAAFETAKNQEQDKLYGSGLTFRLLDKPDLKIIAGELEILKLRLDYKKYQKYREISAVLKPFFRIYGLDMDPDKLVHAVEERIAHHLKRKSQEQLEGHAKFCLEFVIESILRWESVPRIPWYTAIGQKRLF